MKITGYKPTGEIIKAYNQNKVGKTNDSSKGTQVSQGDSLQLSPTARHLQEIESALRDLPEIREDLVKSIKKGIRTGTYQPDAKKIADGIIQERLLDKQI